MHSTFTQMSLWGRSAFLLVIWRSQHPPPPPPLPHSFLALWLIRDYFIGNRLACHSHWGTSCACRLRGRSPSEQMCHVKSIHATLSLQLQPHSSLLGINNGFTPLNTHHCLPSNHQAIKWFHPQTKVMPPKPATLKHYTYFCSRLLCKTIRQNVSSIPNCD